MVPNVFQKLRNKSGSDTHVGKSVVTSPEVSLLPTWPHPEAEIPPGLGLSPGLSLRSS